MPFVISDPQEEEVIQEQEGFVVSPTGAEDTSFSFMKDIAGPAKEFGVGALNLGMKAFGGGPDSMMARSEEHQRYMKQLQYDQQAEELQGQGLEEAQILEKIGQRPQDSITISEGLDQLTGGSMVPVNQRQRVLQKGAEEAGEFAATEALLPGASGLKGLAKWAGLGGLFGMGEQISEESGGGTGSQIATGLTFMAAPYLLMKGKAGLKNMYEFGRGLLKTKQPLEGVPKFLSETGTPKAMADLELSARDLTGRVAKTSEEMLGNFEESLNKVAEPRFKDIGTFRAADIESALIKENQKAILDTISPAAETQKKSWEGIQSYVNENFNAIKESYTKLYDVVETASKGIPVVPKNTFEAASKVYADLERSIIKAPEEGGVKKALEEVVSLLKPMSDGNIVEIPLEQLMAGKRSINRLLEKSGIIPGPIDLLKPVSRGMKLDTLAALESRPSVKKAFEAAENTFGEAQRVYNNDAVMKMRKSKNPEDLSSFFTKPSNLEKLNESVGESKQVRDFVDRLVVENISSKGKAAAQEMARETREFLGNKAQKGLDSILEYGDTMTSKGQQSLARGRVLEDLQKSFDVGAKPEYTLKAMQNPIGYELVKETLNRSPKGKKMWKSLQRQTFEDVISSTLDKNKQIDFEKAKDIFSDPHLKMVVKEALGEGGVKFFNQLQHYGKNMAENIKTLALKDKSMFEKFSDSYLDKGLKYVLYGLAGHTHGASLLPLLGSEVGKRAYRARLYKVLESPQGQNLIKEMGGKNVSSERMMKLLKRFAQVAGQAPSEQE